MDTELQDPNSVVMDRVAVRIETHAHRINDRWTSDPYIRTVALFTIAMVVVQFVHAVTGMRGIMGIYLVALAATLWFERKDLLQQFKEMRRERSGLQAALFGLLFLIGILVFAPFFYLMRGITRFNQKRRRQLNSEFDIEDSPFNARVTCHGEPAELSRVIEIRNTLFEPQIFLRSDLLRIGSSFWILSLLIGLMISTLAVLILLGTWLSHWLPILNTDFMLITFIPATLLFLWIVSRVWRQVFADYYRVVPGRIDMMTFRPFRRGGEVADRIHLHNANVQVKYPRQSISIRTAENPPREFSLSLELVSSPHAFAEAVMHAAITSTAAPPLPDDEFIG